MKFLQLPIPSRNYANHGNLEPPYRHPAPWHCFWPNCLGGGCHCSLHRLLIRLQCAVISRWISPRLALTIGLTSSWLGQFTIMALNMLIKLRAQLESTLTQYSTIYGYSTHSLFRLLPTLPFYLISQPQTQTPLGWIGLFYWVRVCPRVPSRTLGMGMLINLSLFLPLFLAGRQAAA